MPGGFIFFKLRFFSMKIRRIANGTLFAISIKMAALFAGVYKIVFAKITGVNPIHFDASADSFWGKAFLTWRH